MLGKLPRDQFIENIPFPETREYVKNVLAGIEIYKRLYRLGANKGPISHISVPPAKEVPHVQPPPLPTKAPPAVDVVS
jgi:soluble lytic murein transglycosylase